MPTYDYECKKCGAKMEVFQSIKARPLAKSHCPTCAAVRPVRRLIGTGGAVLFKGSGFYQTDYRSAGYKEKAKSETESSKPARPSPIRKALPQSPPSRPKPIRRRSPRLPDGAFAQSLAALSLWCRPRSSSCPSVSIAAAAASLAGFVASAC